MTCNLYEASHPGVRRLPAPAFGFLLAVAAVPAEAFAAAPASAATPRELPATCAALIADVDGLLTELGTEARGLEEASAGVLDAGAAGTRLVDAAFAQTQRAQAAGALVSGVGEVVPGAGMISGIAGGAVTAGMAVDHAKLAADQQAVAASMAMQMERLKAQAEATMPKAMRLQQLQDLGSKMGCASADDRQQGSNQ